MYDIENVALDVIFRCKSVSNLRLQKLLYFVYGTFLYKKEESIINESPQAWMYGPVFPSVYHEYKEYGASDIVAKPSIPIIKDEEYCKTTADVISQLKPFKETSLIALTHREGGAWRKVYNRNISNCIIPDSFIIKEFEKFYVKKTK